jgi:hypothetical protein
MTASGTPAGAALRVYVYRVEEGLGNACLLQFPDGTCGVLDWGTQRDEPLESALQVAKKGFRFVAATHAHADHTLGFARLLRECSRRGVPVEKFFYPASTLNQATAYLTEARKAARECKIPMSAVGVDTLLAPPEERRPPYLAWAADRSWQVRVLSPSLTDIAIAELRALAGLDVPGNETSLVVLFRFLDPAGRAGARPTHGFGRAVFPGDATPATLDFARRTAADFPGLSLENQVFLVPHHGSHHNFPDWLIATMHGLAVVSSSTRSKHHPSSDVLRTIAAWSQGGRQVYCTSYAQCCRAEFGGAGQTELTQPGPCFGHLLIEAPQSGPATLTASAADGEKRRGFGYCGNP